METGEHEGRGKYLKKKEVGEGPKWAATYSKQSNVKEITQKENAEEKR